MSVKSGFIVWTSTHFYAVLHKHQTSRKYHIYEYFFYNYQGDRAHIPTVIMTHVSSCRVRVTLFESGGIYFLFVPDFGEVQKLLNPHTY